MKSRIFEKRGIGISGFFLQVYRVKNFSKVGFFTPVVIIRSTSVPVGMMHRENILHWCGTSCG